MNFWHMQLHPDDINWKKEERLLRETGYIGLGDWDEQISQQESFEKRMLIGDIVAIKRGGSLIALTKVTSDYEYTDQVSDLDWFVRRRKIEVLDWYQDEYGYYVFPRGTLTRCDMNNSDAVTNKTIKGWYKKIMSEQKIKEASELLKYKHQIILQGPPGTGKTRLAKLIADSLTEPENKGTPEQIVDNLIASYDFNGKEARLEREKQHQLLSEFHEAFPKEKLKELTLESYSIGTGENDSFCWWIERGLQILGYYFPGSSLSYKVYWSKSKDEYSKHGFVKDIEDDELAMKRVAKTLHELVNDRNTEQAFERFGNSFILKVLQSYYPNEYFPINSENAIKNALKLFDSYDDTLSLLDQNRKLTQIYLDKKKQFNSEMTKNEFAKIIWSNFNLKSGEELTQTKEVLTRGEYEIIQFHPAYTYEDFVRGIVAKTNDSGDISYEVENKTLAKFAKKATENPNGNYVLIIDEINRANLPAVLGELIYALEYRDDDSIKSMYEYNDERNIKLPSNLYIIGTMNTADRSVGHIDYAIRRRFAFVDILPDATVITNDKAKKLFGEVTNLFLSKYLSPDFHKNDVQIGHSYFIVKDDSELATKWKYEIKPILNEYIKDGILLSEAQEVIDSLYD
ncbi:AAA family ATPase [Psychrobacter namhaensis]|uniref:AAA family ATPase n=1 Tax=Psychrobacter namhaensis TaxID=292734 RepID=A0ABW8LDT6_9GAMM